MRIWTLHPQYLDVKGLTAAWREGLLAVKVLRGETKGYRNHPQLTRFRVLADPAGAMTAYLSIVCDEAERRGYRFERSKLNGPAQFTLEATDGQLQYEWQHLLHKLEVRDSSRHAALQAVGSPLPHPFFTIKPGPIEPWERV